MSLTNAGSTAHYQVSFDPALPNGAALAAALLAGCEADFALMASWFAPTNLEFNFPLPVQILNGAGPGASWMDPADIVLAFGTSPTISINPTSGGTGDLVRALLVAEVVEMFMASERNGNWFGNTTIVTNSDEGSKGEGLSRFLTAQLIKRNGLNPGPLMSGFLVTTMWLNSPRANFIDNNPDDNQPDPTTGCTTCFLYYLHSALGYSINAIIAAGADTLADVYKNLTGKSGGWTIFINLVNSAYPPTLSPGTPAFYPLTTDNIFPIAQLTQLFAPNPIITGQSTSTLITINFSNTPAITAVNIGLSSANPSLVTVPAFVTIAGGSTSAVVAIQAPPSAGPFPAGGVTVTASYAGQQLQMNVDVGPTSLLGFTTLAPNPVLSATTAVEVQGAVSLVAPNVVADSIVTLSSLNTAFATIPSSVTIPKGQISASFIITVPPLQRAFAPVSVPLQASYGGNTTTAFLSVTSNFNHGAIKSLSLSPSTVAAGKSSEGTVTLVESVNVPTQVGLVALTGKVTPSKTLPQVPKPGSAPSKPVGPVVGPSSIASVPSSITIPAGESQGTFLISTRASTTKPPQELAVILAATSSLDVHQEVLLAT